MKDNSFPVFLDIIKNIFNQQNKELIKEDTHFNSLDEWSSLQIMILVSEIDSHYDVLISADEMKKIDTVKSLYDLIVAKLM